MAGTEAPKGNARRRGKPIEVWVNDAEKVGISKLAAQTGLSRSAYLRNVGLNCPVRSVVDLGAVSDLAKVNGDLGRVAGLLKLWLADMRDVGVSSHDVVTMMRDFRTLQSQITAIMSMIVYQKTSV
ncbi:plasmid mobilization protein [Pseudomonas fragi]|jgi:hypothetical protein|uniref:plasmid mobilization protein n=1 Tax=Pseudomonas fragi TaxID=296 RepID=UPI0028E3456D|nr:CopG family transcriptional regulator [Pseudomonas fragi]